MEEGPTGRESSKLARLNPLFIGYSPKSVSSAKLRTSQKSLHLASSESTKDFVVPGDQPLATIVHNRSPAIRTTVLGDSSICTEGETIGRLADESRAAIICIRTGGVVVPSSAPPGRGKSSAARTVLTPLATSVCIEVRTVGVLIPTRSPNLSPEIAARRLSQSRRLRA